MGAKIGNNIDSASFFELVLALLRKIPVLGFLFQFRFGDVKAGKKESSYSGNPDEYVKKFIVTVSAYSSWPKAGKDWALSQMRTASTVEKFCSMVTQLILH